MTELTAEFLIDKIKELNKRMITEIPYGDYKTQWVPEARLQGQILAYKYILVLFLPTLLDVMICQNMYMELVFQMLLL